MSDNNQPKFTPAPWLQSATDMGLWVQPVNGNEPVICDIVTRGEEPSEEDFANLALIAQAPAMFEAIKELISIAAPTDSDELAILNRAKSILAAARGETPKQ